MARRGENIFKRKDGRWEARVIECRSNGKRVYRSLYGKTYTEAKAKKEEYYGINRFESAPSAKKLAAFSWLAGEWLDSVRGTVKESTHTRYYRNVYSYLVPALSKYSVSRLDSTIVNQLKEELLLRGGKRSDGLSEKSNDERRRSPGYQIRHSFRYKNLNTDADLPTYSAHPQGVLPPLENVRYICDR